MTQTDLPFPQTALLSPGDQHSSLEHAEAQWLNTADYPLGEDQILEKWKTSRRK